jgi:hypothetical protein
MHMFDWIVEDHSDSPRTTLPRVWITHGSTVSWLEGDLELNGRRLIGSLKLPRWLAKGTEIPSGIG